MIKTITVTIFGAWILFCGLTAQAEHLRVGLYGGTFDPPTPGHEHVIDTALAELKLDILYVVPNVKTEHKPGARPFSVRSLWAGIAFGDRPNVIVSPDFLIRPYEEKDLNAALAAFAQHHHSDQIYLVLGDESYSRNIESHKLTLGPRFHIAIVEREFPGKVYPKAFDGMPIQILRRSAQPYSSTKDRALLEQGIKPREMNQLLWESLKNTFCNRELEVPGTVKP